MQSAIALLEEAIAQIDHETKARFKETFEAVNEKVQTFFPTLFGGGEARLHMIGDDLLTAGVSIMARPPGKKNSTIHLLSGGEKALTAMSLVFALLSSVRIPAFPPSAATASSAAWQAPMPPYSPASADAFLSPKKYAGKSATVQKQKWAGSALSSLFPAAA